MLLDTFNSVHEAFTKETDREREPDCEDVHSESERVILYVLMKRESIRVCSEAGIIMVCSDAGSITVCSDTGGIRVCYDAGSITVCSAEEREYYGML